MPEEEYTWLPRESILTFEEIARLAGIFASLGATKVRLTGGEPLLRQHLDQLVGMLASDPRIHDVALTTNGLLLDRSAASLRAARLGRVTVSLDTLRPERFESLTRSSRHGDVLRGIQAASAAGFSIKLNSVVIRGFNEDELVPLLEFARTVPAEIRFIEYMDVGGATQWRRDAVVSRADMLTALGRAYGPIVGRGSTERGAPPAEEFALPDGTPFGIIASTTAPFCRTCDRSRLTADGVWFLCLYAEAGTDLRRMVRGGASDGELAQVIRDVWTGRADRGAEERLRQPNRSALYQIESLRHDPHREMHTRGG
jgi:cyclic pyranopterin phosphate synthase